MCRGSRRSWIYADRTNWYMCQPRWPTGSEKTLKTKVANITSDCVDPALEYSGNRFLIEVRLTLGTIHVVSWLLWLDLEIAFIQSLVTGTCQKLEEDKWFEPGNMNILDWDRNVDLDGDWGPVDVIFVDNGHGPMDLQIRTWTYGDYRYGHWTIGYW